MGSFSLVTSNLVKLEARACYISEYIKSQVLICLFFFVPQKERLTYGDFKLWQLLM